MKFIIRILVKVFMTASSFHKHELNRLGSNYGGWYISILNSLKPQYMISAGVGEDISFEIDYINKINNNLKVIFIDPTPKSISHFNLVLERISHSKEIDYSDSGQQPIESYELKNVKVENFEYIAKALSIHDGKEKFFTPKNKNYVSHSIKKSQFNVKNDDFITVESTTINTVLNKHVHKKDFILKIDIEGMECDVLNKMLSDAIYPQQILVEFDLLQNSRLLDFFRVFRVHTRLKKQGYLCIFHEGLNFTYLRKGL